MAIPEKELLDRIKHEPQAFALLYDKYYNAIFGYVFRRTGQYDLAKDITAETFLRAYQKIDFFEWRNISFSAWLYKIASNETNLYFRKSRYSPSCLDDLQLTNQFIYEAGIETEKAALEKSMQELNEFRAVQKQLQQLGIKYQEVIALRFFEEKSMKEISDILGKNEGTVKSLLSRGLEKLRTRLSSKF